MASCQVTGCASGFTCVLAAGSATTYECSPNVPDCNNGGVQCVAPQVCNNNNMVFTCGNPVDCRTLGCFKSQTCAADSTGAYSCQSPNVVVVGSTNGPFGPKWLTLGALVGIVVAAVCLLLLIVIGVVVCCVVIIRRSNDDVVATNPSYNFDIKPPSASAVLNGNFPTPKDLLTNDTFDVPPYAATMTAGVEQQGGVDPMYSDGVGSGVAFGGYAGAFGAPDIGTSARTAFGTGHEKRAF